jgi:tripartite-type tricarboxylate transporter receptor subunit TctC
MGTMVKPGLIAVLAAAVLAGLTGAAAPAEPYPSKPVKMIVPFPPGGVIDIVGRVIAEPLGQRLGQPVLVDNRAGAAGTIGVEAGAKSPADGYTLTLGTTGTLASAPALYPALGYDPVKSFAPIGLATTAPFLVVAHPSVAAGSLRELIDLARAKPNQLSFGSVGSGSPPHIAGEMFKAAAGVDLLHVPYKGLPTAVADLLAGRTQVMFNQLAPFLSHVAAGKLKALAVAAPQRIAQLPGVPTAAEAGFAGYEVSIWSGLLAPRATAQDIVNRLNSELAAVLASNEVQEKLRAQGFDVRRGTPEQFAALIVSETEKWSRAIRTSGAKLD